MVERVGILDMAVYEKIVFVRDLLAEKWEEPDSDRKWEWLDFLEVNVMTYLSLMAEQLFRGEIMDNLPKPALMEWRNPKKEIEFNKLWNEFMQAGSAQAMKVKLERMQLMWRNYTEDYSLPGV